MNAKIVIGASMLIALAAATPVVSADDYVSQVTGCGVDVDCLVLEGEADHQCPLITTPEEAIALAMSQPNCFTGK